LNAGDMLVRKHELASTGKCAFVFTGFQIVFKL